MGSQPSPLANWIPNGKIHIPRYTQLIKKKPVELIKVIYFLTILGAEPYLDYCNENFYLFKIIFIFNAIIINFSCSFKSTSLFINDWCNNACTHAHEHIQILIILTYISYFIHTMSSVNPIFEKSLGLFHPDWPNLALSWRAAWT